MKRKVITIDNDPSLKTLFDLSIKRELKEGDILQRNNYPSLIDENMPIGNKGRFKVIEQNYYPFYDGNNCIQLPDDICSIELYEQISKGFTQTEIGCFRGELLIKYITDLNEIEKYSFLRQRLVEAGIWKTPEVDRITQDIERVRRKEA